MEISEINSKVRYYENALDETHRHISRLQEEIGELEALKRNLYSYQSEFNNANSRSKVKVGNIVTAGLKVVTSYINKMGEILNGPLFRNANYSIQEAVNRVNREIDQKKANLDTCYKNIDIAHRNIDFLNRERVLEEQRRSENE